MLASRARRRARAAPGPTRASTRALTKATYPNTMCDIVVAARRTAAPRASFRRRGRGQQAQERREQQEGEELRVEPRAAPGGGAVPDAVAVELAGGARRQHETRGQPGGEPAQAEETAAEDTLPGSRSSKRYCRTANVLVLSPPTRRKRPAAARWGRGW